MKLIEPYYYTKSIELATCISSGIMLDLHNLIQFCTTSDYAVGVFIMQKVIYYYSHYACELLDACLVDDVGGQPILSLFSIVVQNSS